MPVTLVVVKGERNCLKMFIACVVRLTILGRVENVLGRSLPCVCSASAPRTSCAVRTRLLHVPSRHSGSWIGRHHR